MPEKQRKPKPFITPVGKFAHPRLTTPDTKFNKAGVYGLRLILDAETAEPLVRQIDTAIRESVMQVKKGNPSIKRIKLADKPYMPVLNDNEKETGEVAFNFKMTASGVSKETKQAWQRGPS